MYNSIKPVCLYLLLSVIFWMLSAQAIAADIALEEERAIALKVLADDPVWHALLHYEPTLSGRLESAVNAERFFLSADGRHNPYAELLATVQAFGSPGVESVNHISCRFPARAMWLQEKIPDLSGVELLNCIDFQEWLGGRSISSISMVFAAGHMKSPVSYFGHNFLKFNSIGKSNTSVLLEDTVNYGADIPDGESGLAYFYHGIFGGYSAFYERQPFYRHMAKYGEEELRDVWEYELNLRPADVALIVAHTWELQRVALTYYFFRENCAYQIAKLLALVTTEPLVPKYMPWTMPYNVFAALTEAKIFGEPLVQDVRYHPSRRSRFHQRYFSLSTEERSIFTALINEERKVAKLSSEQVESRLRIIDALIDYYEFRLRLDDEDANAKIQKSKVLAYRFSLPPAADTRDNYERPLAPHLAQRPGYVSLSALHNDVLGEVGLISVRPAYFDMLSRDIGRSTKGEFKALDTTFLIRDETVELRHLDLIKVTNLVPSVTGIKGDSGASWSFRFGINSSNNACTGCLRFKLDWQRGTSWKLSQGFAGFALAGGRLQHAYERDNPLALKLRAGVVGSISDAIKVHASIERHEDLGSRGRDSNRLMIDLRFGQHRDWDVRLQYRREIAEELAFTAGYYW